VGAFGRGEGAEVKQEREKKRGRRKKVRRMTI
jgi:hypothetical protein